MVTVDRRRRAARWLDALEAGRAPWLSPLGRLYELGFTSWRGLRQPRPLPAWPFSIAVGNLRVGGTGKTPVVASLGRALGERGWQVGVVSRGYRAEGGGDEPGWLEQELGVRPVLSPDRRRGFDEAAAAGAQVVLLDDALQSRVRARVRLALVLDADLRSPPRCLPAGPARQPQRPGIEADAVLVRIEVDPWPVDPLRQAAYNRRAAELCGGRAFPFRLWPRVLVDADGRTLGLAEARRLRSPLLVSGLARPQSFERDADRVGLAGTASLRCDDHAAFADREEGWIRELVERYPPGFVLCPEKNLERLAALELPLPLWALRSEVEWSGRGPVDEIAQLVAAARS